jgi:hypothetical protein
MTATERLRQLLDERGVEWWEDAFSSEHRTVFDGKDGVRYCVHQLGSSLFISSVLSVTPEQAVEATLGRGTCRIPETRIDHGSIEYNGMTAWRRCSACGAEVLASPPHYCPNCGRRVVE